MYRPLAIGFLFMLSSVGIHADDGLSITSCYSQNSHCITYNDIQLGKCLKIEEPSKKGDDGSVFKVSRLFVRWCQETDIYQMSWTEQHYNCQLFEDSNCNTNKEWVPLLYPGALSSNFGFKFNAYACRKGNYTGIPA